MSPFFLSFFFLFSCCPGFFIFIFIFIFFHFLVFTIFPFFFFLFFLFFFIILLLSSRAPSLSLYYTLSHLVPLDIPYALNLFGFNPTLIVLPPAEQNRFSGNRPLPRSHFRGGVGIKTCHYQTGSPRVASIFVICFTATSLLIFCFSPPFGGSRAEASSARLPRCASPGLEAAGRLP